jgi:hypothetical protein
MYGQNILTQQIGTLQLNNGNTLNTITDVQSIEIDCITNPVLCSSIQNNFTPPAPGVPSYIYILITDPITGDYWNVKIQTYNVNGNILTLVPVTGIPIFATSNTNNVPSSTTNYTITVLDATA